MNKYDNNGNNRQVASPRAAQEVISPMRAARTRVRLRPWRTSPSSSLDEEEDDEAEEGAEEEEEESPEPELETAPDDDDDDEEEDADDDDDDEEGADVGASTLLHPSITKAHRGPLP